MRRFFHSIAHAVLSCWGYEMHPVGTLAGKKAEAAALRKTIDELTLTHTDLKRVELAADAVRKHGKLRLA